MIKNLVTYLQTKADNALLRITYYLHLSHYFIQGDLNEKQAWPIIPVVLQYQNLDRPYFDRHT